MMKRSTSAPMIPELLEQQKSPLVGVSLQHRRGISTSNVSLPCDFAMKVEISPRRQVTVYMYVLCGLMYVCG